MIKYLIFIILIFQVLSIKTQGQTIKYWVQFTDKDNTAYSIDSPEDFLSQRAIERRRRQNISIVKNDLPVSAVYIDSLRSLGATIINQSKWFNAVTIALSPQNEDIINTISNLSFVKKVEKTKGIINKRCHKLESKFKDKEYENINNPYGYSFHQIHMLAGDFLHRNGYKGEGMMIAVIDAGFWGVDTGYAFRKLWDNKQIIAVKDFVDHGSVFDDHAHGMWVLSILAVNKAWEFVGTAPEADFVLLRSEDPASEYIVEEDNWISAAEFADSIGVDIINSSLGYFIFDDSAQNHSYSDLDGNTTRITRAADIAASKGMIVILSAGNEGNKDWYYIIAPADADSVLAVGAVDATRNVADFSSHGPSFDGRTKPDVVAQGKDIYIMLDNGNIIRGSGTSFSAPIITGLTACLWQLNPSLTNMQIINIIKQSAHIHHNPNNSEGYGLPDFSKAFYKVKYFDKYNYINIAPNPVYNDCFIEFYSSSDSDLLSYLHIFNIKGQKLLSTSFTTPNGFNRIYFSCLSSLPSGMYIIYLHNQNKTYSKKIIVK